MIIQIALIAALIIIFFAASYRSINNISADSRQRKYHKLSDAEVTSIVSTPLDCKFSHGQTGPGRDEPATIHIDGKHIILNLASGETEKMAFQDVRRVEAPDPGTLHIFPMSAKSNVFMSKDIWGIYFGKSWITRSYGDMPFRWQPKAKETREADRNAVAYYLKLKEIIGSQSTSS